MPAEEADLVARARRGDIDAFDLLVRRNQDWLYNFLFRLTGSEADARDLSQDVFLSAWRAMGRFTGESRFSTWLYAIATNAARSHGRHLAVARRVTPASLDAEGPDGAVREFAAGGGSPSAPIERREAREKVQEALDALEPDLREAIVLREIEGLDYATIAQALAVPLGTVKTRIHRARLALREKMKGYLEPREAKGV